MEGKDGYISTLLSNVPGVIYRCNNEKKRTMEFISEGCKELTGYHPKEIIGNKVIPFGDIIYKEDKRYVLENIQRALTKKEKFLLEYRITRRDGTIRWVLEKGQGDYGKKGELLAIDGFITDITRIKESEEKYKESSSLLKVTLESTTDGILVVDLNRKVVDYNKKLLEILEIPDDWGTQKDGKKLFDFALDRTENPVDFLNRVEEVYENTSSTSFDEITLKNGRVIERYSQPQKKEGKIVGRVWSFRDITERKRAELWEEIQLNIATKINTAKNTLQLVECIYYELSKIVKISNFTFDQYDPENGTFKRVFVKGKDVKCKSDELLKEVVLKKKNAAIYRKEKIIKLAKQKNIQLDENEPETWIGIPIVDENEIMGIIIIHCRDENSQYSIVNKKLLEIIGKRLSVFIKHKRDEEEKVKLAAAIEQSPVGVLITDPEGKIEFVNPRFCKLTGYKEEELINKNISLLKSEAHPENYYEDMWQTLISGEVWHGEQNIRKKNNESLWVYTSISAMINEDGDIVSFLGKYEDLTKIKKVEEKLIKSEMRFRGVWENSVDGMRLLDRNGIIVDVNKAFCSLVGLSKEKLIGKPFNVIYKAPDSFDPKKYKASFNKKDIKQVLERKVELWNGRELWLNIKSSFIHIKDEEDTLLLSVFRDVTDRMKMFEHLKDAKKKAEEMNRLKTNFLANMSHELRTPFVGILGYAEELKEKLEGSENLELVEGILDSAKRLNETLNSILEISRFESTNIKLKREIVIVNDVVNEVIDEYKREARLKDIKVKINIPAEEIKLKTDKKLLMNIIRTLVSNGIKFTQKGWVEISVAVIKRENKRIFQLIVKDTGIGISAEKIDLIFEPFRQISEGLSRNYEGMGLELAIAEKYAVLLDGWLSVESKIGEGAKFTLEIVIGDFNKRRD